MANHMAEVAKMLGVELGEEFEIVFPNNPNCHATAVLYESGPNIQKHNLANQDFWHLTALTNILNGNYTIKRKPWKPNDEERYWYVDERGRIWSDYFDYYSCTSHCMNYYKLGNCYRTREEAEANRDKWVSFYESDEVLEV